MEYSLLNRKIEANGVLETARKLGVTIVAYTPLAYGLLSGKYHQNPQLVEKKPFMQRRRVQRQVEGSRPVVEALMEIAVRRGVTPAQVALNWVIYSQGEGVVAIPGATSIQQAAEKRGGDALPTGRSGARPAGPVVQAALRSVSGTHAGRGYSSKYFRYA